MEEANQHAQAGELARLEATLHVLLRPLDHPGADEWHAAVCRAVERLCGVEGATAQMAPGSGPGVAPRLSLRFAEPAPAGTRARCDALLRTLAPALRAGAALRAQADARMVSLARTADASAAPLAVCSPDGRVLHGNAAFAALVRGAGGHALLEHARAAARRLRASGRASAAEEARTGAGSHRVRATGLEADGAGGEPVVLVSLEPCPRGPLSDQELRERFRLTGREVEVARMLAEGLSNAQIGARLFISAYTARNHVEKVMAKLSVPRRGRVAALIHSPGDARDARRAA